MMLMMMFILLISVNMMFMKHPVSLCISLLIQAILVSMNSGMIICNFWISYIMYLIMVGGLLIMFLYMTNVASNEKFKSQKMLLMNLTMFLVMMFMLKIYYLTINQMKFNLIDHESLKFKIMLNKFFLFPFSMILLMMFIYLLLTMIMSVKLTVMKKGPLRQKF